MEKSANGRSKSYLENRFVLVSLCIAIFLNIVLWIVVFSKFGLSRDTIPLHFNVVYGIDLVGNSMRLYQLPAAGLLVFCVNLFLGKILFGFNKLFAYFLVVAAVAVQLLLFAAIFPLVALNA